MTTIEQLESAASLLDSTADMLAHLVMDTPEDQALNDQVIESHRSIARALRDTAATQPAPAGVIDREAANEAARNQLRAQCHDLTEMQVRHKGKMIAGAVLSVLDTRTVAQVKAEALREAAQTVDWEWETFRAGDGMPSIRMHGKTPSELLNARADELEREDKR